jgi:hypothetical protein
MVNRMILICTTEHVGLKASYGIADAVITGLDCRKITALIGLLNKLRLKGISHHRKACNTDKVITRAENSHVMNTANYVHDEATSHT